MRPAITFLNIQLSNSREKNEKISVGHGDRRAVLSDPVRGIRAV